MQFLLLLPAKVLSTKFIFGVEGPSAAEIAAMTPAETAERLTNAAESQNEMAVLLLEGLKAHYEGNIDNNKLRIIAVETLKDEGVRGRQLTTARGEQLIQDRLTEIAEAIAYTESLSGNAAAPSPLNEANPSTGLQRQENPADPLPPQAANTLAGTEGTDSLESLQDLLSTHLTPDEATVFTASVEGVSTQEIEARVRIISVLKNYLQRINSGETAHGGHNKINLVNRLTKLIPALIAGEADFNSDTVVKNLDDANALNSGISLTAAAVDDGVESAKATPELEAQMERARDFVNAFAAFRPGESDLAAQAMQAINNGDRTQVATLMEKMLNESIRHGWHNMYGSEQFETGDSITRNGGRNGEISTAEKSNYSAEAILNNPLALAQALRELGEYDAAQEQMMEIGHTEVMASETALKNRVKSRIDAATTVGSAEYTSAEQQLAGMEARDKMGYDQLIAEAGGKEAMITNIITTFVFTAEMNQILENKTAEQANLPHMMAVYQDMTGISPEWGEWSDANVDSFYNNLALTIATAPIALATAARMGAMIGRSLGVGRGAVSTEVVVGSRTANVAQDAARAAVEVTAPQVARLGATTGFTPNTLNAFRISLNNLRSPSAIRQSLQRSFSAQIDDGARIITNFSDETLETIARAARRPGNALNEALTRAVQVTRTQLDEAGRLATNTVTDVLPATASATEISLYNLGRSLSQIPRLSSSAIRTITEQSQRLGRAALNTADDIAERAAARSALVRQVRELPPRQLAGVSAALVSVPFVAPIVKDTLVGLSPGPAEAAPANTAPVALVSPSLTDTLPNVDTSPTAPAAAADTPTIAEPTATETEPVLNTSQKIDAITASDMRSHAAAIADIVEQQSSSYVRGDSANNWEAASRALATEFGLTLETEADVLAFGAKLQTQMRDTLGLPDTEAYNDGKLGLKSMAEIPNFMISVSGNEILSNADTLQAFEAQTEGGWRANNKAMAQLFGIDLSEANDDQLKVFGDSVQRYAYGAKQDGKIGPGSIAQLKTKLAEAKDA